MSTQIKHVVLVIVAHTDDEVLGAGGVIAKHSESGDQVYAIAMTNGVSGRMPDSDRELISVRSQAAYAASIHLGFTWLANGDFPDNALDTVPLLSVVKFIEKAKSMIDPTIIYTHSCADLNIDHRMVAQATLTAFRPHPNERWTEIRAFEVTSATDYGHKSVTNIFQPNIYINIKDTWNKKLSALQEYHSEMRNAPHARSYEGIENLAKHRGYQVGLEYAEAFELIRKVER